MIWHRVFIRDLCLLQELRLSSLAAIDAQREIMRYMSHLNEWLSRDVIDRQQEIRSVAARVDELKDGLFPFISQLESVARRYSGTRKENAL